MRMAGEATRQPMAATVKAPKQSSTAAAKTCKQATAASAQPHKASTCAASPSDSTSARDAAAAVLMEIATGRCAPPVICRQSMVPLRMAFPLSSRSVSHLHR